MTTKESKELADAIAAESYTKLKDYFNGLNPYVMVPTFICTEIHAIALKRLRQHLRQRKA
jgi:hypothetical protein